MGNPNPSENGDAAPSTAPKSDTPPVVCGKFRFLLGEKLGAGGFGSVFRATCLDTDASELTPPEQVALKVIQLNNNKNLRQSIRQELASLLAIRSNHIPRVYDWDLQESYGFVAMELYEHGTLREEVRTRGPLTDDQTWALLRDLLRGLKDAHAASILHLDIKPSNVLVKDTQGFGAFALADFGISRGSRTGDELRSVGMGTRYYYAPEQARKETDAIDMRTDLYGVGSTVWSAYTGTSLSSSVAERIVELCAEHPHALPSPSHFRASVDPKLEAVLMSLLYRDARNRPGSAAEVLGSIEGLNTPSAAPLVPGEALAPREVNRVVQAVIDPLWSQILRTEQVVLRRVHHGDWICRRGERSHLTYILLTGKVEVLIDDRVVAVENREGTFLGEVSALTGNVRTASLRAHGDVVLKVLNASQLERFVTQHPAIGIRLLRSMAERLDRS